MLPTIVKGVPLRLREHRRGDQQAGLPVQPDQLRAAGDRIDARPRRSARRQNLSSPFQVDNCSALKFKPAFKAATSAKTSKANGASLKRRSTQAAGQANIKSVKVQLPKALPSRLTTLQKACPAATFEANPFNCPSGSFVGGARANTPTLPGKLTGPAILVSHGGAAFPDLDLVLEANGVRVDPRRQHGHQKRHHDDDVRVDARRAGDERHGEPADRPAQRADGERRTCAPNPLIMPTTITGQNGMVVKQNTQIKVNGCGVRIVGHKVVGNTAYMTVQTFAAGRISGKGRGLATSLPQALQSAEEGDAEGAALARRAQQAPPVQGQGARRLRAQGQGRQELGIVRHGDLPLTLALPRDPRSTGRLRPPRRRLRPGDSA